MYSFWAPFTDLWILLVCVAGTVMGIIWGAMPGLSPAMALALGLGLTYTMPTPHAIVFLLSVLISATFGGAISAILINIPGTPNAVPTQFAGFPLAKKGQGGLAIGTAITSCMMGNWAGFLLIFSLAPFILPIAMKFHSWEVSLLFVWAVSICGTMGGSSEGSVKGWISGFLGLLIALVGQEAILGYDRLTFGIPEFTKGISLIPIIMGLFGLTEIFDTLSERIPYRLPERIDRVFPSFKQVFRYWKSIIRSSLVGLWIGILPAAGPTMAAFVAYSLGERITKRKFSEGDLEGVVCSEVAGNAEIGGALLPTLVLGIPGSTGTAILLASLAMHGIVYGPMIDFEQPGILNFFYGTMILANIAMFLLAFVIVKPIVKLFSLPREILLPSITIVLVAGAFVEAMSMADLYIMFFFGLLGILMRKTGFDTAPLCVGLVLGDMLDVNFRRAMVVFKDETVWQVLSRPIGAIIIIILLLTIWYGLAPRKKSGT